MTEKYLVIYWNI